MSFKDRDESHEGTRLQIISQYYALSKTKQNKTKIIFHNLMKITASGARWLQNRIKIYIYLFVLISGRQSDLSPKKRESNMLNREHHEIRCW
jgi:hypothetical protein